MSFEFKERLSLVNGQIQKTLEYVSNFIYSVESGSINAGTATTDSVTIQADSDFVCEKITIHEADGGSGYTFSNFLIPTITVQLTDVGSGRALFDEPVYLSAIAGNGFLPYNLPVPHRFSANSKIQASFVNPSSGTDYTNVIMYLHGYKARRVAEFTPQIVG